MATGYADSSVIVNSAMYNQVKTWQGHAPYGWGRYFYSAADNGTTTSSGLQYYDPGTENGFFHSNSLRLLPIARQESNIATNDYTTGHNDAQLNLKAVLKALGGNATTPFFAANGKHYCAFMLDCESTSGGIPSATFTNYLHGWLEGMGKGVTDSSGNLLVGWTGVYSAQSACTTWTSVVDCANTYGIRPDFIDVASWITGQTALPTWNEAYTSTKEGTCDIALGQSTVLWQYAGNAVVTTSSGQTYYVDLDEGNPNLDFHTALGQYAPIPN